MLQHAAFLTQAEKTKKRNERRRTSLHPSLTDADDLLAQARSHLQPVPACSPFPLSSALAYGPVLRRRVRSSVALLAVLPVVARL